ncbi:MAG: hypothetical protein ACI8Z7_000787 [Candidatus Nanohaloarchaea archaeon]|jgi:hypothetical protein
MSYDRIWESTKSSVLVTWCVLFSYALAVFLDFVKIIEITIPFTPSTVIYFFGALQSSVFAVIYVKKNDWSYYAEKGKNRFKGSPSEL